MTFHRVSVVVYIYIYIYVVSQHYVFPCSRIHHHHLYIYIYHPTNKTLSVGLYNAHGCHEKNKKQLTRRFGHGAASRRFCFVMEPNQTAGVYLYIYIYIITGSQREKEFDHSIVTYKRDPEP